MSSKAPPPPMSTAALRSDSQNNSFNSSKRSSPMKQVPTRAPSGSRKEPTPVTAKISSNGAGRSPSPDLGAAFIGGRALTKQALDVNDRLNVSKGTQRSSTPAAAGTQAAAAPPPAASGPDDAMTNRLNKLMKLPRSDGRPEMYRVDLKQDSDLKFLHELRTRRDPLLETRPAKASPAGAAKRNEGTNKIIGSSRDDSDVRSHDGSVASSGSNVKASRRKHIAPPSPMRRIDSGNSSLASGKRIVESPSNRRQQLPPWEQASPIQLQSPTSRQHFPASNAESVEEAKQLSHIRITQPATSSQGGMSARGVSPSDAGRAGSRGASATAVPRPNIRTKEVIEAMQRQNEQPTQMPPSHYRFQKGRQQSPLNHVIFTDRPDSERMDTSAASVSVLPFNRNELPPKHILAGKVVWLGREASPRANPSGSARRAASSDPNDLAAQQPIVAQRRAARSVTPPGPAGRRGSSGIFDPPSSTRVVASPLRSKVIGHQLHHLTSPENTLVSNSVVGVGSPTQTKHRSIQTKVARYADCMSGGAVVEKVDPPAHYGKRQAAGGFLAAANSRMADALSWGH